MVTEADDYVNSDKAKKGSKAELLFEGLVKKNNIECFGAITAIKDVSKDKEWQKYGIDFILTCASGVNFRPAQEIFVDVKSDDWLGKTGNFCVEMFQLEKTYNVKKAWFYYTKADYGVYYSPTNNEWWIISLEALRTLHWQATWHQTESTFVMNKNRFAGKAMLCWLIPDELVRQNATIIKEEV